MDTFAVPAIKPRYKLTVMVKSGMTSRDKPGSQNDGANAMNTYAVGSPNLYAFQVIQVNGVPYAQIVPRNPTKPEWMRVAEADNSLIYLKVEDLYPNEPVPQSGGSDALLISALTRIADQLVIISSKMK